MDTASYSVKHNQLHNLRRSQSSLIFQRLLAGRHPPREDSSTCCSFSRGSQPERALIMSDGINHYSDLEGSAPKRRRISEDVELPPPSSTDQLPSFKASPPNQDDGPLHLQDEPFDSQHDVITNIHESDGVDSQDDPDEKLPTLKKTRISHLAPDASSVQDSEDTDQGSSPVPSPAPIAPPRLHYKPRLILRGHKRAVAAVKYSPDGKWIASCCTSWPSGS